MQHSGPRTWSTRSFCSAGRRKKKELTPVQPHLVLKEALKLIRSAIPSSIEIRADIRSTEKVLADPSRIHQVVMNLCTNAYHAMRTKGGILTVSLTEEEITTSLQARQKIIRPGKYLKLEIADTGHGIDPKILEKIFDPYFTTKGPGQGTGFGLAIVQAIVDEHDGFLDVKSRMNQGTCFTLYFPIASETAKPPESKHRPPADLLKGSEHIMLVEDEESIRQIYQQVLESQGYTVTLFENGAMALKAFEADPNGFDLILSDLTMPGLTGDKLVEKILEIRPGLPFILSTGFDYNPTQGELDEPVAHKRLRKPVSHQELLHTIRNILGQRGGG